MPETVDCARCGAPLACGARDAQCWCASWPPLRGAELPLPEAQAHDGAAQRARAGCLCAGCLREAIDSTLARRA